MKRPFKIFTALLCSVSCIPLTPASAMPTAPLTDWHVAPVLASSKNKSPYCAMATNYPQAGLIITHARNKHGSGTVAFDFQNAAFEAHQFYGIDISFAGTTQQFAAEAKNTHLLVIDLRNDHPLYAALDAGRDIDVSVQQGGPHVTVAGNSRAFFQLNYCVQALTDAPAGEIVAQAAQTPQPSFGLQQPASRPVARPIPYQAPRPVAQAKPVAKPVLTPAKPLAKIQTAPVTSVSLPAPTLASVPTVLADDDLPFTPIDKKPERTTLSSSRPVDELADELSIVTRTVAQNAVQDGDETREQLSKMLDQARTGSSETASSKRQKLSEISGSDDVAAPSTKSATAIGGSPSRQNLLFDDPDSAASYAAPHLSEQNDTLPKSGAVPAVKPVAASAKPTAKPAPAPVAKPVATASAAKPMPAALPEPLPLPADADRPTDSLSDTVQPASKPPVKTGIISDTQYNVSAKEFVGDKPLTPPVKTAAKSPTPEAVPAPAPSAPTIVWDDKPAAVPAPIATPDVAETPAPTPTPVTASAPPVKATPVVAPVTTAQADKTPLPLAQRPIANILSADKRAALLQDTPVVAPPAQPAKLATAPAPVASAKTALMAAPVAPVAPIAVPAPTIQQAKPVKPLAVASQAKHITPPQPVKSSLRADDVIAKASQPASAKMPATASVAPAPALPPALISEDVIPQPVLGPMKRAEDVISVDLPDQLPGDDTDVAVATPSRAAVPGSLKTPDALRFNPSAPAHFTPPAAATSIPWQIKSVPTQGKVPGYCVIQARFANQQNVFLSRAIDGNTMIGLDFGMDLLQRGHDYKTTVQVDNAFNEDFLAEAREANLLVVQAGRKDSLFQALSHAKALHIELEGGATTFDIQGLNKELANFDNCLTAQGGTAVSTQIAAPTPAAVAAPAPAVVMQDVMPAPVVNEAVKSAAAPAKPALSLSAAQVNTVLQNVNIPATAQPNSDGYSWGSRISNIKGRIQERRFLADKVDIIEAAMRDIDAQESACHDPSFTSQIGLPDQSGNNETVTAETSCTVNNQTTVSALVYQRIGQLFRVWSQTGPQSAHDLLIKQRDRLADVLQRDKTVASTTDQSRS